MNRGFILWFIGGCLIIFAALRVEWGPYWVYPLSIGILVTSISILKKYVSQTWYLGLMFWIPATGMCTWQRQLLHLDMMYPAPREGLLHILKLFWQCHQNLWILLAASSLILIKVERRLFLPMLGVTFASGMSEWLIEDLVKRVYLGSWNWAHLNIWLIEIFRAISLCSVFLLWSQVTREQKWSLCLIGLLNGWLTAPMVGILIWTSPITTPTLTDLPLSQTELGSIIPSAVPSLQIMHEQLDAQGTTVLPKSSWWCETTPKPNWSSRMRTYSVLEMSSTTTLHTLQPHLFNIFSRGISEIGFLQQSLQSHSIPPLNRHLNNPVQHWVLDPYPADTRIGVLTDTGIEWRDPEGTLCAIWVGWDTTQQTLSDLHSYLSHQCSQPFGLLIGEPSLNWVSPIDCSM